MAINSQDYKKMLTPKGKEGINAPRVGAMVNVHQNIIEQGKKRIQIFKGVVISVKKANSLECTFTVRREINKVGVERIYPLYSPNVVKIETLSSLHVKEAKMYYLRNGYKKRLRETKKIVRKDKPRKKASILSNDKIEKKDNKEVKSNHKEEKKEKK